MGKRAWIVTVLLLSLLCAVGYFAFFSDDRPAEKAKWQRRESQMKELEARLQETARQIRSQQGESRCENDGECRVRGMGTRVCGEYKDFLVYSIKDAQEPRLLELLEEFNALHETLSNLLLTTSRCGTKPLPIRCAAGRCTPIESR